MGTASGPEPRSTSWKMKYPAASRLRPVPAILAASMRAARASSRHPLLWRRPLRHYTRVDLRSGREITVPARRRPRIHERTCEGAGDHCDARVMRFGYHGDVFVTLPDHRNRSPARSLWNPATAVAEVNRRRPHKDGERQRDLRQVANDPRLRQTGVLVCTTSCTLVGTVHLMTQHRLLDELNSGFVANLYHLGDEYLRLTEVRIVSAGGEQDIALSTHVRKPNILFVAERSSGHYDRASARRERAPPTGSRARSPPRFLSSLRP